MTSSIYYYYYYLISLNFWFYFVNRNGRLHLDLYNIFIYKKKKDEKTQPFLG